MLTGPLATPALEPEDPLAYLPCSKILEFGTGHVIYSPKNPPSALYVMIDGMVKVQRIIENKAILLVDIYRRDDLFGESAFTGSAENHEIATAMEKTQVMAWTRHEIEQFMPKRPRLSLSLIQWLARRCQGLNERIEACASDSLDRRLARTLIYFSERFGCTMEEGSRQIMPMSHELLAEYIGTSRELVTRYMTQFRLKGYVSYSRRGIILYPEVLRRWLTGLPNGAIAARRVPS